MKRLLLVMSVAALLVMMVAFSALPALAQNPSCEGLRKAAAESQNPQVISQARAQGCLSGLPETGGILPILPAAAGAALLLGTSVVAYGVLRRR